MADILQTFCVSPNFTDDKFDADRLKTDAGIIIFTFAVAWGLVVAGLSFILLVDLKGGPILIFQLSVIFE